MPAPAALAATVAGIVGLGSFALALGLGLGFGSAAAGSSAATRPAAPKRSPVTGDGAAPADGPAATASAGAGGSGGTSGGAIAAFLTAYLSPTGLLWAVVTSERVPSSALLFAVEVPG